MEGWEISLSGWYLIAAGAGAHWDAGKFVGNFRVHSAPAAMNGGLTAINLQTTICKATERTEITKGDKHWECFVVSVAAGNQPEICPRRSVSIQSGRCAPDCFVR